MSEYGNAIAAVRRAREERDAARERLYTLELRRLALGRAHERERRGEGATDPADRTRVERLRANAATVQKRLQTIRRQLEELSALPAELEALHANIHASKKDAAALLQRTIALAGTLKQVEAQDAHRRAQEELRAAQSKRAALEGRIKQDVERVAALEKRLQAGDGLRKEAGALEARSREIEGEVAAVNERIGNADLREALAENAASLAEERQRAAVLDARVKEAIAGLYGRRTPQQLIEAWDDSLPILLLPVRVETRWKTEGPNPELRVRVYPDDAAVNTHEKVLTEAEEKYGRAYWESVHEAATDPLLDANAGTEAQDAAWQMLARRFGANRAAWVALQTKPLNWADAATDADMALAFPDLETTKPDGWTVAPHTRVLPDRWVVMAWRGDTLRVNQVGNAIDDIVVLGPAPLDEDDGAASITRNPDDGTLSLGNSFDWVRDFDRAVDAGMAFRIPVSDEDIAGGFDRLLVLGIKLSSDENDARVLVEDLLDNHHYSHAGLELLKQGTPTNNTDGNESGYTSKPRPEVGVAQSGPPAFSTLDDRSRATDGQRLADFIGIGYSVLQHVNGAENTDHAEAVAMNRALYAGTLGYYLDHMLNDVIDDRSLAVLRRHFTDGVTGRGPIAAIRVGKQPYGILPTSALARWRASSVRPGTVATHLAVDSFEDTLLHVLRRFDESWSTLLPRLKHLGAPGDGAANLLEILALHPNSAEFYQRVGYSYDYLRNLESFAWAGDDFDDVIGMAIEGMAARTLLRGLGYEEQRSNGDMKPHPLLLQLIWRHYHTRLDPRQLIDGQPLSERDRVRPYDAAGTRTFLDWLFENASSAEALERQDFGDGVTRPGSLLYLMLHFALVMEASRGVHDFLSDRGVVATELVRSRKFLNIGTEASPSVWEVFRAPANRIVQQAGTDRPLLEIVHTPQFSDTAGRFVQEQREALDLLRSLPTARLERALVEHIDTLSYRLDAWQTSLFTRRLHRNRRLDAAVSERRTGVYLGGFGYLENVRPDPTRQRVIERSRLPKPLQTGSGDLYDSADNGGFVHAPSLNHATAAALLRSGYLTHATPEDPDALAVNLSSARVRRARYLIDGIRNGQSLEVLLGVQFERGLHDWTTRSPDPVILDHLKPTFRAAFPIQRTKIPQASESGGATLIGEDHHVVNGLTLANTTAPFPYGVAELAGLSDAQKAAIIAEKDAIANTLDALHDVLTAEAAYQLALGNFDRAAAIVQSVGNGTTPPEIEVLDTPRGTGISFTQRLAVRLSAGAAASPWSGVPMTERARLEPSLNAWLGMLLGDPATIRCRVSALAPDGSVLADSGGPVEAIVSAGDLGIQPIDFVYITRSQVDASGEAELEARIRYRFARSIDLADDVILRITFADAGGDPAARSFAEVLPLADRLRRVLGTARPLDAQHFQSASKDDPAPPDNPGRIDTAELRARVVARVTAVRDRFPALQSAVDDVRTIGSHATVEALRAAMQAIADTGFTYALPKSATGSAAAQVDTLVAQADALIARAAVLGQATDKQIVRADAATGAQQKIELLSDAVKAWMGADMLLLPRFVFHDATAVAQADAAQDDLLSYARDTLGIPLPVEEWLHGAACVRPLVHDLEMVRTMAEALNDASLSFSAVQLPLRHGDAWLGTQVPPTMQVVHDTISIVQHVPQSVAAAGPQCGLLIDEWTETVPAREEVTGVAFNYNAPNSAPPQVLLLAVSPDESGRWSWDDLAETVLDTFRRAKLRAIEPDHIGGLAGIGTLLPAVIAEFSTSRASVSLDYSFVLEAVRAPAIAAMYIESQTEA